MWLSAAVVVLGHNPSSFSATNRSCPTGREAYLSAKVGYLAIDPVDPNGLVQFWCGMLGVDVDTTIGDGDLLILSPTAEGLTVGLSESASDQVRKQSSSSRPRGRRLGCGDD